MNYSETKYFAKRFYLSLSVNLAEHNSDYMDVFCSADTTMDIFRSADTSCLACVDEFLF